MDLFSFYKVKFTIFMTFILLIVYFKKSKNINKLNKLIEYKIILVFFLSIIISFLLSDYKEVALKGFVFRYEGTILLLSYLTILYVTINIFNFERDYKMIMYMIITSYLIITIVCISQYINKDIILSESFQKLIIPRRYSNLIGTLKGSTSANHKIVGLIGNSNYLGEYYAIILPLFISLFIYHKEKKYKLLYRVLSILGLIMITISLSETAIISIALIILLFILINFKKIFKFIKLRKKYLFVFIILFIIIDNIYILNNNFCYNKVSKIISKVRCELNPIEKKSIQGMQLNGNKLILKYNDKILRLILEKNSILLEDKDNKIICKNNVFDNNVICKNINNGEIIIEFKEHKYAKRKIINIKIDNNIQFSLIVDKNKFKIINDAGKIVEKNDVKIAFGKGKEELFTGRIYIWSRTIPKILERPFFGYGADTFEIVFPNYDYVGLYKTYSRNRIIVDKPHNMYIGIAINIGIIALISFFLLNIMYLLVAIKKITIISEKNKKFGFLLGILMSILSYLICGIVYDSNIVSTSIYYILLGIGIKLNYSNY